MSELLRVSDLRLEFPPAAAGAALTALRGVSFSLAAGERLGVVGESGAGKSLLAYSLINLPPPPSRLTGGGVFFENDNLLTLPPARLRRVRGRRIAMIFQDPMTTLNPVLTIGTQLRESLEAHGIAAGDAARRQAEERLREVAIPSPAQRMRAYPHELSGGMRQRVVIAAALITEPALIIADEPTTALDVTTQAEIMALLTALCRRRGMSLILITHDLSLLAQTTDSIMVMYSGLVAERGDTGAVTRAPRHPYTRGLLASLGARAAGGRFYQIPGNMPPLSAVPGGCPFHPRCRHAQPHCADELPPLLPVESPAAVACHYAADIAAAETAKAAG